MIMNYNISFEISAIIFLGVLLLFIGLQYDLKVKFNRCFFNLVVLTLFTNMLDIISAIAIDNYTMIDPLLNTIINLLFYMIAAITAFYFYYVMLVYVDKKASLKKMTQINILIMCIYVVLLIVNIFKGLFYTFTIEDGYVHGSAFVLCIMIPFYYILCGVFLFLSHYQQFSLKQGVIVGLSLIVALSGSFLQFGIFPDILLSVFTPALGIILMMVFLESTDYHRLQQVVKELEQIKSEKEAIHRETEEASNEEAFNGDSGEMRLYAPEARLLAVDDNRMDLDCFCALLRDTSITVDLAQNGEAALSLLREKKYDMVFLDQTMPILDGVELFQIIQDEHICEDVPIIVFAVHTAPETKEELLAAGFTDYLAKPIHEIQLLTTIKKYLAKDLLQDRKKEM